MRALIVAVLGLALAGCGSKVIVSTPKAHCADLTPSAWAEGVEAAPIPTDAPVEMGKPLTEAVRAAIVAPWAGAYVMMSAALEVANGRTVDAIGIPKRCEALMNAARAGD